MKKSTALLKILIITGFLAFFLFNVGTLRCESPPGGLPPQAKRDGVGVEKTRDQARLEDQEDREVKNEGFRTLEWLIKQKLMRQYEKMEIREELDD